MKFLLVFLAICLTGAYCEISLFRMAFEKMYHEPPVPAPVFRNNIDVKYIEQKLDNFNVNDGRTWYMRYMSNDYYFKEGGPIFIFVGGEWEISEGFLRGGHMFDMAKHLNGYMFYTEHRFYGRSQPFTTLTTSNLQYLDVKQALADLAQFIRTVKQTIPGLQNSKVILVGGSYSATMVTWFSRIYPNLVDGAWASSAPLEAKVDFVEYKEVVGASITKVGGAACYDRIKNAIAALEEEIENHQLDKMQQFINICPDFNTQNKDDVWMLFSSISNIFSGIVQAHNKGNIETVCQMIMSGPNDIEGVGNFLKTYLGIGSQCVRVTYQEDVNELKKTTLDGDMRQWYYQTCNEYGWYQTSGSPNQPFGSKFPVELYLNLCRDVYDMTFDENKIQQNIEATNKNFGALNPEVKNVFSTHGTLDPWHAMGLLCDGDCGAVVPLYAHCKDLSSVGPNDTQEMINLKQKIFDLVIQWTNLI